MSPACPNEQICVPYILFQSVFHFIFIFHTSTYFGLFQKERRKLRYRKTDPAKLTASTNRPLAQINHSWKSRKIPACRIVEPRYVALYVTANWWLEIFAQKFFLVIFTGRIRTVNFPAPMKIGSNLPLECFSKNRWDQKYNNKLLTSSLANFS